MGSSRLLLESFPLQPDLLGRRSGPELDSLSLRGEIVSDGLGFDESFVCPRHLLLGSSGFLLGFSQLRSRLSEYRIAGGDALLCGIQLSSGSGFDPESFVMRCRDVRLTFILRSRNGLLSRHDLELQLCDRCS